MAAILNYRVLRIVAMKKAWVCIHTLSLQDTEWFQEPEFHQGPTVISNTKFGAMDMDTIFSDTSYETMSNTSMAIEFSSNDNVVYSDIVHKEGEGSVDEDQRSYQVQLYIFCQNGQHYIPFFSPCSSHMQKFHSQPNLNVETCFIHNFRLTALT